MSNKSRVPARRPLWIITCYRNERMEFLTFDPDGDGEFLPVFSFEEEAETFLCLSGDELGTGWHSRETTRGELVSVLLAPRANVRQVALDPLPLLFGKAMLCFVSTTRERFVQNLLGDHRECTSEIVPA